jgi:hypothetical protein
VRAVSGVKKLYWHAVCMSKEDQPKANLPSWVEITAIATKAQARLVGTMGVADVNFRTAADDSVTVYLLCRARAKEEATKALARVRDSDGKKVVNYVEAPPLVRITGAPALSSGSRAMTQLCRAWTKSSRQDSRPGR